MVIANGAWLYLGLGIGWHCITALTENYAVHLAVTIVNFSELRPGPPHTERERIPAPVRKSRDKDIPYLQCSFLFRRGKFPHTQTAKGWRAVKAHFVCWKTNPFLERGSPSASVLGVEISRPSYPLMLFGSGINPSFIWVCPQNACVTQQKS